MRRSGWSRGTRCSRFNTINIDRCCRSSPRIRRFLLLHHSTHCLRRTIYQFVSGVFQQPASRPKANVAGSQIATFISVPPWRYRCGLRFAWNIRSECSEDGARTLLERVKSVGTLNPNQHIADFVEYCDPAFANQKAPSAPDAIVKSGFLGKE